MITLGVLALGFALIRIFVFKIPESPRFLISRGRDADAVEAVNYIARYNGKPETLTLEMIQDIDRQLEGRSGTGTEASSAAVDPDAVVPKGKLSYREILRESFREYGANNYRKLFAGRKLAQHTSITFLIWLTVGIA